MSIISWIASLTLAMTDWGRYAFARNDGLWDIFFHPLDQSLFEPVKYLFRCQRRPWIIKSRIDFGLQSFEILLPLRLMILKQAQARADDFARILIPALTDLLLNKGFKPLTEIDIGHDTLPQ